MRALAIDWGSKRLGLALSDASGILASPLAVLNRKGDKADIGRIIELIKEHEVDRIVVGVPLGKDGEHGESAQAARKFSLMLEDVVKLPVVRVDERYSTHAAERALLEGDVSRSKRKNLRDSVAAAWFLQLYLDSQQGREGS